MGTKYPDTLQAGSARERRHAKAEVATRGCSYKGPSILWLNKSASPL